MRFQVLLKKENVPGTNFFPFFETDDIHEAKDFAMRLAFEEFNLVKVMDTKRQELVRDFDAAIYRERRSQEKACPVRKEFPHRALFFNSPASGPPGAPGDGRRRSFPDPGKTCPR